MNRFWDSKLTGAPPLLSFFVRPHPAAESLAAGFARTKGA
jgi:hypothetical protein